MPHEKTMHQRVDQTSPDGARHPGFITDVDIGLGDVIKRATHTLGIKPCAGCDRRAAALNRWFVFTGRAK
jgi:hypothetical protein